MADSVVSIITSAARRIGSIPEEQDVPDYINVRGLEIFNDILDEWGAQRIYIPYQSVLTLQLQTNQENYLIGNDAGYALDTDEIMMILQMNIFDPDAPGVAYPTLPPMTETVYANIPYRTATGIPVQYLLRNHVPGNQDVSYSEIFFQPLPYKPLTASIVCKQRLARVSLTDTLTQIPREFTMGLKYKLAINLAQVYGKALTPQFSQLAMDAISTLESSAVDIDYMTRRDEQLNRKNIVYFNWWL